MTNTDLIAILPLLLLTGYACLLLLVDLLIPQDRKAWTAWLALIGLMVTGLGMLPWPAGGALTGFNGMIHADGFAVFLNLVFLLSGGLTVLLALNYLPRTGIERGEFYVLLLFTLSGMMLMAQAADLIVVFLALELLSIPLYI
ncbi:MAG: NADH-quinone oxidoreductase subunit N, partial [Anaerolineales bacterium]